MPQKELLSHPGVKLFVSHCGSTSGAESIYFGVPTVCYPVTDDGWGLAKESGAMGVGKMGWSGEPSERHKELAAEIMGSESV